MASAAVALILQSKPAATPDQVKDWLVKSATYVPTGPAANLGLKELNVNAALARSGTTVQTPGLRPGLKPPVDLPAALAHTRG